MLAGLAGMAVNLLTTPIVLHAVGPQTFGLWMTLVSSVSYLSLADIGIASSIGRFVGRHRAVGAGDEVRAFFGTVAVMYAVIFAIVLAGGIAVTLLLPKIIAIPGQTTGGTTAPVVGIALSVAITIWTGGLLSALHASQQLPLANYLRIVAAIASGGLLIAAALTGSGIVGLAAATAIAALLGFFLAAIAVRRRLPWISVGRPSRIQTIQVGSYGAYMFVIFLASTLNFQTDNLVIAATVGVGAVTAYSIALRVTRSFVVLLHKIPDVMFPFYVGMIGRHQITRLQSSFLLTARLELAAATCICVFLALAGPTLLGWWVGRNNVLVLLAFWLALIMVLVEAAVHPAAILAIAAGGERKLAAMSILEAITNVGLSIIFAKKLGVTGVILGTVVAHCLFTGWWLPRWAVRRVDLRLRDYAMSVLAPCIAPGILSMAVGVVALGTLTSWRGYAGLGVAVAVAVTLYAVSYSLLRRADDLPAAVRLLDSLLVARLRPVPPRA
jgi:O-antigen/teichoic acid export membrane protein